MPKILLESFKKNFQEIKLYLARNQSLKYIVNENFISNQQSSFFIGVAKFVSKIKFLYNEHNSLSHFLFGNNVRIISKLSDYYLTLGWKSNKKNILPFGSLFLYDGVNRNREKKIDVLYLANIFNYVRHTHWNISTIERSLKYKWYEFSFNFFSHIDPHIIKNLKIKNPVDSDLRIGVNTICEKTFNKFFSRKQILSNEFNFKDYLYKSRFVIIDSYWTSHLEAIIANIPFIILKPKNFINYLPSNNAHNILINSKIIYDDPILAAKFVNNNYIDYDSWWFSKKVQDARKLFIDQNLKSNEFFINKVKCFQ
jgi:putative transferase (TIGR04331 family)